MINPPFLVRIPAEEAAREQDQPAIPALLDASPHRDDHQERKEREIDVFAEEAAVVDERGRSAESAPGC